jgi:tetratricopeptide (TPR) repeat protein
MTPPMQTGDNPLAVQLERIENYLRERRAREAEILAAQLVEENPQSVDGWLLLSRARLALMQYEAALDAVEKAVALEPNHPGAQLQRIDALMRCGRSKDAYEAAKNLEAESKYNPVVFLHVGQFYSRTNRRADAARCYERVRVLQPANRSAIHRLANAYSALGELDKAESLLDELLRKDAREFEAHYNRSMLRRQTTERNHIAEMEILLATMKVGEKSEPSVCYSLAKELEDVGEWKHAFSHLKRGADARKRQLAFDVRDDIAMLDEIRRQFDESFFAQAHPGDGAESPIFVLGMPRSGTSLVDRIISSHSEVGSVGESDEFSQIIGRRMHQRDAQAKVEFRRCRDLDFEGVGREFRGSINGLLPGYPRLLDKTTANFMYIGLILTAFPNAKIIHVRRHPVDSCYAVYKALFRRGSLFSYDLEDTGHYYLAYRRLMDHWRKLLPDRFLDLDYEELVDRQEDVTRRMIGFCGLDWQDACLFFEKNTSPLLTASAAQVRQPIYKSSVGLWRHYEEELQPLIRILREGGIEIA